MNNKKILLIDDEPDVIVFMTTILEEHKFNVFSISDMKSALEKTKEINPDLICLDIMMPGETGISFYTKLRQDKSFENLPVIIVSGAIDSGEFKFHSYITDMSIPTPDGFLEKPIKVNEFVNIVANLLNLKK